MGGNIPGGSLMGGNFPGGVFLEPFLYDTSINFIKLPLKVKRRSPTTTSVCFYCRNS